MCRSHAMCIYIHMMVNLTCGFTGVIAAEVHDKSMD